MRNLNNPPNQNAKPPSDVWVYRLVVGFLGTVALTVALGVILIISQGGQGGQVGQVGHQELSASIGTLAALGSAAVGALAGLLAPTPSPQN
jgi:hypothetical protein